MRPQLCSRTERPNANKKKEVGDSPPPLAAQMGVRSAKLSSVALSLKRTTGTERNQEHERKEKL